MTLKRYGCSHTVGMQQMAALSPSLPPLKMKRATTITKGVVPSFYKFIESSLYDTSLPLTTKSIVSGSPNELRTQGAFSPCHSLWLDHSL